MKTRYLVAEPESNKRLFELNDTADIHLKLSEAIKQAKELVDPMTTDGGFRIAVVYEITPIYLIKQGRALCFTIGDI